MEVVFLILFVTSSQLIHSIAVDQQQGFNPYPFGTTIFCIMLHPMLLISSIFYLGWLWGSALFLCHLFGILHCTVSWIFDIPVLLTTSYQKLIKMQRIKIGLLVPTILANAIFTVTSFFTSNFKSLLRFLYRNTTAVVVSVIIVIVLSVLRIFVSNKVAKSDK